MVSGTGHRRYKTQPLECWGKAKELRLRHYKGIVAARERGRTEKLGFPPFPVWF